MRPVINLTPGEECSNSRGEFVVSRPALGMFKYAIQAGVGNVQICGCLLTLSLAGRVK